MSDDPAPGRLSVSEERIQRLFADFETRLVTQLQRYVTRESLAALEKVVDNVKDRVHVLELAKARSDGEDATVARFSARTLAYAAIAAATVGSIAALIAAIATFYWLRG